MDFKVDLQVKNMYETTFILVPELSEDEYKKAVKKFEDLIKNQGGSLINTEHWGQRKLAYPMQKKTSGYYAFIEFEAPGEAIGKLEQEYIYDESVIRYLTVKLDKYAVAYNKKRREQGFGSKEEN